MKNITLKILSTTCIAILVVFTFFIGQSPLIEGKHLLKPYIDTEFAKDYNPEKFDKIKIGMTIDEAIKIVGEPLYKGQDYFDTLNTNYYYTSDGKLLHSTKDNGHSGYEDFAWYRSTLEVDRNNKVIDIDKGWSRD
jgi:outer membrane protein assembly factor BamE (lipoprotein component of BamABCDE complex)